MENWIIVQTNKKTGEEKYFLKDNPWNNSKETAERGAELRRLIVSSDDYDVSIRQVEPVR